MLYDQAGFCKALWLAWNSSDDNSNHCPVASLCSTSYSVLESDQCWPSRPWTLACIVQLQIASQSQFATQCAQAAHWSHILFPLVNAFPVILFYQPGQLTAGHCADAMPYIQLCWLRMPRMGEFPAFLVVAFKVLICAQPGRSIFLGAYPMS